MTDTKAPKSGARSARRASKNTAQEALRKLAFEGVEFAPHRSGAATGPVEELLDIYATRGLLEEQAARLAARHVDQAQLAELERLAHAMQAPLLVRNQSEVARLHREFHLCIYRAAERPHLLLLIEQLWDATGERVALLPAARAPSANEVVFVVRSLIAACRARDASALGLLVRYECHQAAAAMLEDHSELHHAEHEAPPRSKRLRTLRAIELDGDERLTSARFA